MLTAADAVDLIWCHALSQMLVIPKCGSSSWLLRLQLTLKTCIPTPFVLVRQRSHSHSLHRRKIGTIRYPSHMDQPFLDATPPGGVDVETAEDSPYHKSRAEPAPKNAFSELMMPKVKKVPKKTPQKATKKGASLQRLPGMYDPNNSRDGLYPYIESPESQGRVILHDPSFVLIHDLYPKATVHLLLLPRDLAKTRGDPRIALSTDDQFLQSVREEAEQAAQLAAKELARRLGPGSHTDNLRILATESPNPPEELPAGRDWRSAIKVGIHAHPSMSHLHIHIISVDMHSDCMLHRNHYNSFNTDFFVPLEAFPLPQDSPLWHTRYQNAEIAKDFRCWRCGKNFENKFAKLKRHIDEEEFSAWSRE